MTVWEHDLRTIDSCYYRYTLKRREVGWIDSKRRLRKNPHGWIQESNPCPLLIGDSTPEIGKRDILFASDNWTLEYYYCVTLWKKVDWIMIDNDTGSRFNPYSHRDMSNTADQRWRNNPSHLETVLPGVDDCISFLFPAPSLRYANDTRNARYAPPELDDHDGALTSANRASSSSERCTTT